MIFIGDIAQPWDITRVDMQIPNVFEGKTVIANLEGAIAKNNLIAKKSLKEKVLFNNPSVIDYLKLLNVQLVSLANNHIFDISDDISFTKYILEKNDIKSCGAGINLKEAEKYEELIIAKKTYVFLTYGWNVIGCIDAKKNSPGVNPLNPENVLNQVKNIKMLYPEKQIIVMFHWNYELEYYPQPMFRQLSRDLIDAGANLIIGHHSHCIQGVEFYKEVPIVYGLGNWLLPSGFYWNEKLKFPDIANTELAFEWDTENQIFRCHWFSFDNDENKVKYLFSEELDKSNIIETITPFNKMKDKEYINWFKLNRRKNVFLPIYKNYKTTYINNIKNFEIKIRGNLLELLMALNLKGGPK